MRECTNRHQNAHCDTSSRLCIFNEGFSGTGMICASIILSLLILAFNNFNLGNPGNVSCSGCSIFTTCASGVCSCKNGYYGNGTFCQGMLSPFSLHPIFLCLPLSVFHFLLFKINWTARCGNGTCDSDENCVSCPQDCGVDLFCGIILNINMFLVRAYDIIRNMWWRILWPQY